MTGNSEQGPCGGGMPQLDTPDKCTAESIGASVKGEAA